MLEDYRRFNPEHCLCTEFWKYASCWHVFCAQQKVDGVWGVARIRNARWLGYEQHPPTKKQKTMKQEADKEPAVHLAEVPKAGRAQKQKTKRGTKRPREEDYYPEVPGDGTPLNDACLEQWLEETLCHNEVDEPMPWNYLVGAIVRNRKEKADRGAWCLRRHFAIVSTDARRVAGCRGAGHTLVCCSL